MPFAGYEDFDDCVAQNQDADDPEAYCAAIQQQVEGDNAGGTEQMTSQPSQRWAGVLVFESADPGLATGDGRIIDPDALVWDVPLPLRVVQQDVGAHDGAEIAGRIESIYRGDDGAIYGEGVFDLDGQAGAEAARQVASELQNGVSVDLDEIEFEVRDQSNRPCDMEDVSDGTELLGITSARVRAATLVAVPAFRLATIHPADGGDTDRVEETSVDDLAAGAPPVAPPSGWFADPQLQQATPLTVSEDGRVFGHLAEWGVCHTAQPGGPGTCTTPPSSASGYARFHVGSIDTSDGSTIGVGRITMGTGHAGQGKRPEAAAAHYDNTGTAVADVRAGEDAYGIWVAGALRPGVSEEQKRTLRASPLSGDWRRVDGALELHAALAVNVPGFPVVSGMVASGELASLTATGVVPQDRQPALSEQDVRWVKRMADRERSRAGQELADRVKQQQSRSYNVVKSRRCPVSRPWAVTQPGEKSRVVGCFKTRDQAQRKRNAIEAIGDEENTPTPAARLRARVDAHRKE